jgi:PKD repeat protein
MPTSPFKITPTPPTSIQLEPGQGGKLSFTVECLAAPDKVLEIMAQALLVGEDGKGKEAEWLTTGPRPTLSMSGGETETVTITAKPKLTSPRGEHKIKLVIADKDRPNDVYTDSPVVACEVLAPSGAPQPKKRPPWWLIPVIAGGLLVVGGGALLVWRLLQPDPPVAAAAGEPLAGRVPLTVTFRDTSTGNPSQIAWSFGDGSPTSERSNPSHTYQTPGTYTVELTARNKRGASTAQLVVKAEVPLPPAAVAAGAPLAGRPPLTVRFQSRSTGGPSKVEWRFGDGSPISEEPSPTHTYRTPGTYTAELTARDRYGGATTARLTVKVEQPSAPVAAASGEPLAGRVPLTVSFQDQTAGNPRRVEWNFGDGSPISRESNPSHVYQKPGSYTVTLTAWNSDGVSSAAPLTVKAEPPPPVAVAVGDPLSGRIPLIVRFQSRSTGNPAKVEWNFGDGTLISEESNPVHTYTKAGTYNVQLTARDTHGGATTARLVVRAEAPPPGPVAQFQPSLHEGKWPLEVSFTDRSQNVIPGTQWQWSFGDGQTSTERSPRHRFEDPKEYGVRLRVSNANGASESESVIRVLPRKGELHPQRVGPFGGHWGAWAGQFQRCPDQTLAYGFADKVEPPQGGGDDTALNGIKIWCVSLPDLQSNSYITSDVAQWGDWSERLDCGDRRSYIAGARLRIEAPLGSGDDTGAVDVEFSCSNGTILRNGGPGWGAWTDWRYCPASTAICGIKTRIEPPQGGGDDTALDDVEFQCCYAR